MTSTALFKDNRIRLVTISLIFLLQSFQAFSVGGLGLFLPEVRQELGLSFSQAGMLSAINTFIYALMQIPAGYLVDKFGVKRVFFTGAIGTTILSLGLGLIRSFQQGLIDQALAGFFTGMLFMPGMIFMAGWFPPERRATALGLSVTGVFSGNVILAIFGPSLVAAYGWRFPIIAFSAIGVLCSFGILFFGKESPTTKYGLGINVRDIANLFRYPVMWVCGGIQFIRLGVMQGLIYWMPSLLVDEKGLSLRSTGFIIAIRMAVIALSPLIGGYFSDKLSNHTLIIGLAFIVLAVTTPPLALVSNIALLVGIIMVNAFFVQVYFGPLFAVPVEVLGTRMSGVATGFGNLFANLGAFSFTYVMGVMKDASGAFQLSFWGIAGFCIIGIALTLALNRILKKPAITGAIAK